MRPLYVFRRSRKTQVGPNDYGLLIDGGDAGGEPRHHHRSIDNDHHPGRGGAGRFRGQRFPPPVGAGGRPPLPRPQSPIPPSLSGSGYPPSPGITPATASAPNSGAATHVAEAFRQQGMALSFAWRPAQPTGDPPSPYTMPWAAPQQGVWMPCCPAVMEGWTDTAAMGAALKPNRPMAPHRQ